MKLHGLPFISPPLPTPPQQQGSARANSATSQQPVKAVTNPLAAALGIGSGSASALSTVGASQAASTSSKPNASATSTPSGTSSTVDLSKPYRPGTFINFTA